MYKQESLLASIFTTSKKQVPLAQVKIFRCTNKKLGLSRTVLYYLI